MAIMYPNNFPKPLIDYLRGEAKVYEALKTQLDNNWTVYSNVIWANSTSKSVRDGEIDFIVSHPKYGVLVLEIKGGMQIVFHPETDSWNSIDANMSGHSIKNPYEQARSNKYSLLNQLTHIPEFRKYNTTELNELLNVRYAVVFSDVTRISSGNLPSYALLEFTLFEHDVRFNLNKRFINILKHKEVNSSMSETCHKSLKTMLAPSFTLDRSLKHWISDEEHQMMELSDNQLSLLNILQFVNKASIYGCAGSGKTLLAIKKAEQLSSQGLSTLLVCFNNILGLHLSKSIVNENLMAGNFHAIIQKLLIEYDVRNVDLYKDDQILDAFIMVDFPKYDCLLIDEAQDFSKDQMDVLHLLLKENGIIYYFWDANQRIIRKDLFIPEDVQRFPLNTNLRNTEYIFNQVKEHYKQELNLKHKGPQGRNVQTLPPYDRNNQTELFNKLRGVLNQLLINEELKPEDITILTFKAKNKSSLGEFHYERCEFSLFEDVSPSHTIRVDTVRRFKGMESNVVIVCEMDDQNCMNDPELFEEMRYVAYSRAKHHLVIIPYI